MSCAKIWLKIKVKNIDKNISKNLDDKYSHKGLDYAKQSTADTFKTTSKKVIQKTVEPNLIGKKIGDEITKVSNIFQQNNLEINKNEHDREIPKERHISPEERQKIVNDLLLI